MRFPKLITPEMIYFDMDGTLFDLYGVEGWLSMLRSENPYPYQVAAPMVDMAKLRELMLRKREQGIRFGVVSWLSKESSPEYKKAVRITKMQALEKWLGLDLFNEIHLVKYGTPKHYVAETIGILIDDDFRVREAWERRGGVAVNPLKTDILEFLST